MKNAAPLRVGVHTPIARGLCFSVERAKEIGCDCFQIFARNPRGWAARPLHRGEVKKFREAREHANLWPLAVHSVYLINLAAQDPFLLNRSREVFREEILRAIALGADYLVVHPGSPVTAPAEVGLATAIESVRVAAQGIDFLGVDSEFGRSPAGLGLTILIENTAGQGSAIGCNFDQVAELLAGLDGLPVDVCLDTAHTFTSGYDISSEVGLNATLAAIDSSFGFGRVKLVHCNDSKAPLGSRVDRHQHIGLGYIGRKAFNRIANDLKFQCVPFILETPVDKEHGDEWNLQEIRELSCAWRRNG
jgi:deoxyribonuclease-4